jgi:hypothetical protein
MSDAIRHPRSSSHPVVVEVTIQAPLQRVWGALRDPAEIRRWHGWACPELDAEIDIIYRRTATISDVDFTLETGAGRFELEPLGEATVVRVCRPAPENSSGWEGVVDEINEGWLSFVQQLRFYLERHAGRPRRSVRMQRVRQLPSGEVFFASAHQTGLVLEDAALLVASPQHMTLNAYGMEEGDFASLHARLIG